MLSMTGHGRATASAAGWRFEVEVHSVNRKQADVVVSLPRELTSLESAARERVQSKVARGRVNVGINARRDTGSPAAMIDMENAGAWLAAARELQTRLGLAGEIRITDVLAAPGVLQTPGAAPVDTAAIWEPLAGVLDAAMDGLLAMRAREGRFLARDLVKRLKLLREMTRKIRERIPASVEAYRLALNERIAKALLNPPVEPDRIAREVVLFADRSDVSEELTRIEGHLVHFAHLMRKGEPVGRTLDFLSQEIGREFNTLGVKSSDAEIAREVVRGKSEIERIREQVQNIE